MIIQDYLLSLRIASLRRMRKNFDALRADAARSFDLEVGAIEENRQSCAEKLKVSPSVFDKLLVRFARRELARGRTLQQILAEFSDKEKIPGELEQIIRECEQVPIQVKQSWRMLAGSIHQLPALISDALVRESRDAATFRELPLDVTRELGVYRRSILIGACVLLILFLVILAAVVYSPVSRLQPQALQRSGSEQGDRTRGGGSSVDGGVIVGTDEKGNQTAPTPTDGQTRQAVDDARSALHSALLLHIVEAVLLVGGVVLLSTAKPGQTKRKVAGAAMSILSGLSLFPIKEVKIVDKLAEKIEINIGKRAATNAGPQEFQMQQDCTVEPFHGGGADVNDPDVQPSLTACSDGIRDRQRKHWRIGFMVLVGHADKRNLTSVQRANFGSNEALAYRRALAVRTYLLHALEGSTPHLESHMIVMSSGAGNVGLSVPADDLAKDRCVVVHVYWVLSPAAS